MTFLKAEDRDLGEGFSRIQQEKEKPLMSPPSMWGLLLLAAHNACRLKGSLQHFGEFRSVIPSPTGHDLYGVVHG